MDHLARAQRMLELQEAENARVSFCLCVCWSLKHPIDCSVHSLQYLTGWSTNGFCAHFIQSFISSDRSDRSSLFNTQLEIAQKHPDIYAVPMKLPKPNINRPQPIG